MEEYDVLIIGSGPSGLTAAIYCTRANLKTLVLAGRQWGGQLMLTSLVENFPGFPDGIMGPELMMRMRKQAENYGVAIKDVNFKDADYSKRPFRVTTDDGNEVLAKSIIIATGAETKWLGVPGEREKIGRGVSSCAPCDAAFYREKNVIVVGGGDSAMEEAIYLTKFAKHVFLVHRRRELRASEIMKRRGLESDKIDFILDTKVVEISGGLKVEKLLFSSAVDKSSGKIPMVIKDREVFNLPEDINGVTVEKTGSDISWSFLQTECLWQ
jgi:thioredoxin reductase (NADPH)